MTDISPIDNSIKILQKCYQTSLDTEEGLKLVVPPNKPFSKDSVKSTLATLTIAFIIMTSGFLFSVLSIYPALELTSIFIQIACLLGILVVDLFLVYLAANIINVAGAAYYYQIDKNSIVHKMDGKYWQVTMTHTFPKKDIIQILVKRSRDKFIVELCTEESSITIFIRLDRKSAVLAADALQALCSVDPIKNPVQIIE